MNMSNLSNPLNNTSKILTYYITMLMRECDLNVDSDQASEIDAAVSYIEDAIQAARRDILAELGGRIEDLEMRMSQADAQQ